MSVDEKRMVIRERYITAEEFELLARSPEYAEKRIELVEGIVVEISKAGGEHGVFTGNLFGHIWAFNRLPKLGWVTAAETGFVIAKRPDGRDSVRGLDIAFVRMERAPQGLPKGNVPFAPDLAVEVISPHNEAEDIHNKVLQLLRAGTEIIWIVYPESRTVVVHTKDGAKTLTEEDTLDGGAVLPGFTLPVKAIFEI
jgi:Uma2 family endonuclease